MTTDNGAGHLGATSRQRVRLTGAKYTLLYTLYFRALDARSSNPLVDDQWAPAILDRLEVGRLRLALHAGDRYMVLLRARQLDRWTTEFLTEHPDATVLQLGCGLDSRAFRLELPPDVRWYDVDYPEVVELRRRLYPDKPNHHMIASSITEPDWLAQVPTDRPTLVIAEGVFPYVEESDIRSLVDRLMDRFDEGQLMFDGLARWAVRMVPILRWGVDDPTVVEGWHERLTLVDSISVMRNWEAIPSPFYRGLLRTMQPFRSFRDIMPLARYRF